MKEVPVGRYVAWVDDEDYESVIASGPWFARRDGRRIYAVANTRKPDGSRTTMKMHKLITGFERSDHRTHALVDKGIIDNRRSNLRDATPQQNQRNVRKQAGRTSRYKGTSWDRRGRKWRACIQVNRKTIHLGMFTDERDAARAYNEAAKRLFGEYALLNEVRDES